MRYVSSDEDVAKAFEEMEIRLQHMFDGMDLKEADIMGHLEIVMKKLRYKYKDSFLALLALDDLYNNIKAYDD